MEMYLRNIVEVQRTMAPGAVRASDDCCSIVSVKFLPSFLIYESYVYWYQTVRVLCRLSLRHIGIQADFKSPCRAHVYCTLLIIIFIIVIEAPAYTSYTIYVYMQQNMITRIVWLLTQVLRNEDHMHENKGEREVEGEG